MMLIADCGGTKCDWILVSGGEVREVRRLPGVNMATAADGSFAAMLRGLDLGGDVREIHFYGAGCLGAAAETAERLLRERFPEALTAEAASDMLGAARAVRQGGRNSLYTRNRFEFVPLRRFGDNRQRAAPRLRARRRRERRRARA